MGYQEPVDRERSQSPEFGSFPAGPVSAKDTRPVDHLEVIIEADKWMAQRLRQDISALDDELARLDDACRFEEREAIRERAECERIGQEKSHLTQQLEASKRQLRELKSEHEGLHLEGVLLRCDPEHGGKELQIMQRLLGEGTRDTERLQQSIEYLEQTNFSLQEHTRSLQAARHEVLEQVRKEKELLAREQHEAEEIRKLLEKLRGPGVDSASADREFASNLGPDLDTSFRQAPVAHDGIQQSRRALAHEPSASPGESIDPWRESRGRERPMLGIREGV